MTIDAGQGQGLGIGEGHVAIETIDEHGMIRRELVDPVTPRQLAAPRFVIPIAAGDPAAGGQLLRKRGQALREFLRGLGAAQIHAGKLKTAAHEMGVIVNEARHHEFAGEIDNASGRAAPRRDFFRRTHRQNLSVADRHRLAIACAAGAFGTPVQMEALV